MRIKGQCKLQPFDHDAHCIIIEDNNGNPIFVALQLDEAIASASIGDKDFYPLLRALGVEKTVTLTEFVPKPIQNIVWTP
jgi:hypothetical protein